MAEPESKSELVVLAPDLVGSGFGEASCGAVLNLWRDGRLRPVVNRELLLRYLKLLRALGLSEVLIRRWGWWFSSPDKVLFLAESMPPGSSGPNLCAALAQAGQARWIISRTGSPAHPAPEPGQTEPFRWITADQCLQELALG